MKPSSPTANPPVNENRGFSVYTVLGTKED